jgi:hypothetical protein
MIFVWGGEICQMINGRCWSRFCRRSDDGQAVQVEADAYRRNPVASADRGSVA